ncbi:MAG: polysaccharide biosynthesis/export family protein [Planctomycetota bacterium]|jgi:polysaccharide export outer membrane protein
MIRAGRILALGLLLALAGGCRTSDDARVLQVLNQRGFGRPTHDANRQYYIGIGDSLVLRDRIHFEYNNITEPVRMDGVITLPDVGEVYVNGLSPDEATEAVRLAYDYILNDTESMSIEVVGITSKRYYVTGLPPRKARALQFRGDELLVDALIKSNMNETLVDTEEILVIRGDPENPLVITCNFEDIMQRGLTRDNIQIRENDIIYLTPSIVGYMTAAVNKLVSPLAPLQQLVFGFNNIIAVSDSFGQTSTFGGKGKFKQF